MSMCVCCIDTICYNIVMNTVVLIVGCVVILLYSLKINGKLKNKNCISNANCAFTTCVCNEFACCKQNQVSIACILCVLYTNISDRIRHSTPCVPNSPNHNFSSIYLRVTSNQSLRFKCIYIWATGEHTYNEIS